MILYSQIIEELGKRYSTPPRYKSLYNIPLWLTDRRKRKDDENGDDSSVG